MRRLILAGTGFAVAICGSSTALAGGALFVEDAGALDPQPCGGGGCYTRYLRVADLDGDGDLDILFPNDGGGPQPLVVYQNDGSGGFTNVSATAVGGFTGDVRQVGVGDIDGDGDLDIYAPNAGGNQGSLFINDGNGVFSDEGATQLPASAIPAGSTRFGDLDNDGDLDIIVADLGSNDSAVVYLNDGLGTFTPLADAIPFDVGADINDIDLLDVDRDFDLDLMTNAHFGANRIWINDGTGHFGDSSFSYAGGLHYGPGVCDIDDDGDLDIWIDNQGPNYTERLLVNDGTGDYTDVTVAQVNGNPNSDDNGIQCADVDNDGDYDAVVVALSTPERVLINDGDGNFTYMPGAVSGPTDSSLWAELGDLDGDGRLDMVTGEGESGSFLNRVYLGTTAVPVDSQPPHVRRIEPSPQRAVEPGETVLIRYSVSDNAFSDGGPRLVSAYGVVDPQGQAIEVAAGFMGGDLFRVELPSEGFIGEVDFQLCAEDRHGNVGCSDLRTFEVAGDAGGSDSGDSSGGGDTTAGADTTAGGGGSTGPGPGDDTTGVVDPSDGLGSSDGGSTGNNAVDGGGGGEGCSCRASSNSGGAWPFGLLGLLMLLPLRRRRRA